MNYLLKKIIAIIMTVILCVAVCFPVSVNAMDNYSVFSMKLLSQEGNIVKISLGLIYESFTSADITIISSDENAVCKSIDYTDTLKKMRDDLQDSGEIFTCEKNFDICKVSMACSCPVSVTGDYFVFTFEMSNDKPVSKYDFYLSVDDMDFDVFNMLPNDFTESKFGKFTYINDGLNATIVNCDKYISGSVIIPEEIGGYFVTSISPYAFNNCTEITDISIPETVEKIGAYAFSRCTSLSFFDFSNCNIKSVENNTFEKCIKLKNIIIPDSVKEISDFSFAGCSSLASVNLNSKLKSIGEGAFLNCSSINGIDIPDSVESVGINAFNGASSLEEVFIGQNLSYISPFTFFDCYRLEKVLFRGKNINVGMYAFDRDVALSKICFSEKAENINSFKIEENNEFFNKASKNYQIKYFDGHYYRLTSSIEGNCEKEGLNTYVCMDCYNVYREVIPSGHDYSDWKLNKAPSFDEYGDVSRDCRKCGKHDISVLSKVTGDIIIDNNFIIGLNPKTPAKNFYNHFNFPGGIMTLSGTNKGCFVTGSTLNVNYRNYNIILEYKIVIFGDVNSDGFVDSTDAVIISCISNNMLSKEDVGDDAYLAADCNHDGVVTDEDRVMVDYTSLFDKSINQTNEPEKEHNFNEMIVPPSCTEKGYTVHTCTICGKTYEDSFKDALGHKYSEDWTVIQKPTYTSIGYKTHCCDVCGGKSDLVAIPKLSAIVAKDLNTVIDVENGLISGIEPGMKNISEVIKVTEYGYKIECCSDIIGTGAKINITKNGTLIQSYTVLIFGDVNGDGHCDAMDSVYVSMIVNGMIKENSLNEVIRKSADCNGDGLINEEDVELLKNTGLYLSSISQKR